MKRTPRMQKIEELMRSDRIVAGGLLGHDQRPVEEIIEADEAELARLDVTREALAERMTALRDRALAELGNTVSVGDKLDVWADDNRGMLICPFGDGTHCHKTVTYALRHDTGEQVQWADLNIHLVANHGFFEGRGSAFRMEPARLVEVLF